MVEDHKQDGRKLRKKKESNTEKEINKVVGTVKEPRPASRMPPQYVHEEDIIPTRQKKMPILYEGYYLFGLKCAGCAVGSLQMENKMVTNQPIVPSILLCSTGGGNAE
jgi:hypothetical protein